MSFICGIFLESFFKLVNSVFPTKLIDKTSMGFCNFRVSDGWFVHDLFLRAISTWERKWKTARRKIDCKICCTWELLNEQQVFVKSLTHRACLRRFESYNSAFSCLYHEKVCDHFYAFPEERPVIKVSSFHRAWEGYVLILMRFSRKGLWMIIFT